MIPSLNFCSKFLLLFLFFTSLAKADFKHNLDRLEKAYPDFIESVSEQSIVWRDGTRMKIENDSSKKTFAEKLSHPTLKDQIQNMNYPIGKPTHVPRVNEDPGRVRYDAFFKKMYGESKKQVEKNLVTINWMPRIFNHRYRFRITRVNHIDKKLQQISNELENVVEQNPSLKKFLEPNGTYNWRLIAVTDRLSPHSFGMAIDINTTYSNYWEWDLAKKQLGSKEFSYI